MNDQEYDPEKRIQDKDDVFEGYTIEYQGPAPKM